MSQLYSPRLKSLLMVVPCYNESERFSIDYWKGVLANSPTIQWLFVNDGSRDETSSLIDVMLEFGAATLHLDKNSGKAEAIRAGLLHSESFEDVYIAVGYVDADMAFNDSEVVEFCESARKSFDENRNLDCQIASRVKLAGSVITRSTGRHYLSRIVATGFGIFWSEIPYDTQCGLKVFRKTRHFDNAVSIPFLTRWLFDIELMSRISSAKEENVEILEKPLKYWGEVGLSKINLKEKFRIFREILFIAKLLYNVRKRKVASDLID